MPMSAITTRGRSEVNTGIASATDPAVHTAAPRAVSSICKESLASRSSSTTSTFARRRAVNDLGDERQRLEGARPKILHEQQRREVSQVVLVGHRQHRPEPFGTDVSWLGVVMVRQGKMPDLAQRLVRRLASDGQYGILRRPRLSLDQVLNQTLGFADDAAVWRGGEVANRCGMPVIASSRPQSAIQSLLHNGPLA